MSTFMANKANIERKWYVVDAAGKPLGKTAVIVADLLRGKGKVTYTPHADCGDNVIVIIAGKAKTPDAVPGPYLGLGIFTLILCVVLFFMKLPNINEEQQADEEGGERKEYKSGVFSYAHVWFGMLGFFFYLGI